MRIAKILKRAGAMLLCAAVLAGGAPRRSASAQKDLSDEYALMQALGIYEDENSETVITRRALAKIISRITGAAGTEETVYRDVSEKDPAYEAIMAVSAAGIMTGYGGAFSPDETADVFSALTALMRTAGYFTPSEGSGGYYNGYLKFASREGLLKGVSAEKNLCADDLTQMLYNFLEVRIFSDSVYETSGNTISEISDETVLGKFFNADKWRGKIAATPYAALSGRMRTQDGFILINDKNADYIYRDNSAASYEDLGREAYFYTVRSSDTILYTEFISSGFKKEEFLCDKITSVDRALTKISYTDAANKAQTLNISGAVKVYNGVQKDNLSHTAFSAQYGFVTAVDADSDGTYDIIYLWDVSLILVDTISFRSYKITDKISGSTIDFDESDNDVTVLYRGASYPIDAIKEYDTLLVAKAQNGTKNTMTIFVCPESVSGTVTAKGQDSVELDGQSFGALSSMDFSNINIGERYILCVFYDDTVLAALSESIRGKTYAYALNLGAEGTINKKVQIKAFTQNGKEEILNFAKRFKLNGANAGFSDLQQSTLFNAGSFKEQLVSYKLNQDGEINELYISGASEEPAAVRDGKTLILNKNYSKSDTSQYYRLYSGAALFNGEYLGIDNITKVFHIIRKDGNFEETLSSVSVPSAISVASGRMNISVYDADTERVAGACVIEQSYTELSSTAKEDVNVFVVGNVRKTINGSGEEKTVLTGFYGGKETAITENETLNFDGVKKGDVLRTYGMAKGLYSYSVLCGVNNIPGGESSSGEDEEDEEDTSTSFVRARTNGYYGSIVSRSIENRNVFLTKTKAGTLRPVTAASYTCVYKYNVSEGTLATADISELDASCQNVYFSFVYGIPRDIIIYI